MATARYNWAGNYQYQSEQLHQPASIAELQELVRGSNKLRVLGSRHSFNAIADSPISQVSLEQIPASIQIDAEQQTATFSAWLIYSKLCQSLHNAGYAIHNMASLPHISVVGACATATHGSGDKNGNLASQITALEFVNASGELVQLSRAANGELFNGAVVHLGGLGVITSMTIQLLPNFLVQQEVYEELPTAELLAHFDEIMSSAYSVSLFGDWRPAYVNQVWLKRVVNNAEPNTLAPSFFGAKLAPGNRHPIPVLSAAPCTEQMGVPGPWHERLPHFRIDQTPSNGEELQSEYFVARQDAVAAIKAIGQLYPQIIPYLMTSEVRSMAADNLWMSQSYQQDRIGIHFTWKRDWPAVQKLLPLIEAALAPYAPIPHWGKLFTLSAAEVRSRYSRLADFQALLTTYDPEGKFRNPFLDQYIFGK